MKPKELVEILKKSVIEENFDSYQNLLETTNEATDPIWKGILPIYIDFSKEEKETFLKFLRIVEINTLSHVLGIFDGTTYAEGIDDEFIINMEGKKEKLNGDLQNLFLELIEEEG